MTARNYSNTAVPNSFTISLNNSDVTTTATVLNSPSGWPAVPFTADIDATTASEEVVLVTNVVGTSVTFTRGFDGTAKKTHSSGATISHYATAIDYQESNGHVNATANIHGLAGGAALVGTSTAQTLTNKTIASPTISSPVVTNGTFATPTMASPIIASNQFGAANHDHTDAAHGGQLQVLNLLGNFNGNTALGLTYPIRGAYNGVNQTTTSSTYQNLTSPSVTFVGPPSGTVRIDYTAPVQTASGIIAMFLAPICSSGTLVATDNNATSGTTGNTVFIPFTGFHTFSGLTPGNSFTASLAIRSGTNGQLVTLGTPASIQVTPLG